MECGGGGGGGGVRVKTIARWWWWENNSNVVMVEEDRKKKNNENVVLEAVVVVFVLKGKSKKEGEARKLNCGEEEGGTRVSLKLGLLLERACWSSDSSMCTICSPRIREPKLEKIVGQ